MSTATCPAASPLYRGLFPDWHGRRPLSFFFMEQLLEARAGSRFPTNGLVADEDVNVYLGHLLTGLAVDPRPWTALFGSGPQFHPPAKSAPRHERAHWYRRQADQRLLYLGLFDRGEGRRRRAALPGMTAAQTRRRDMICGSACYQAAADLLAGRDPRWAGIGEVMRKLGDHFDEYVHVLGVLGVRRLGLRSVLSERELQGLLPQAAGVVADVQPAGAAQGPKPLKGRAAAGGDMDEMLDLWLQHARSGSPADLERLRAKAGQLGISAAALGNSAAGHHPG